MFQAIEKLNKEKEKLAAEFKQSKTEYKSELKRINTAIKHFSQGYEALDTEPLKSPPKRGLASEIESILKDGAMHIKRIVAELTVRGFSPKYQSVSAILQVQAKAGEMFVKVAPATFGLIPINEENSPEQTVAFKKESVEAGGEDA